MALGTRMDEPHYGYRKTAVVVVVVVVVVVFTLNRSSYPTTSAVPPVSFVILHPREIQISVVTDSETEKNQTSLKNQGRQIKCSRTGCESTTKKTPPEK